MKWLLLIATIPGQNGGLRLRFWRQIKALGGENLRDGVYLLPGRDDLRAALISLRSDLLAADGNAYVLDLGEQSVELEHEWIGLFERNEAYSEWQTQVDALLASLPDVSEADARRQLQQCRKNLDMIAAIDYFPSKAKEQTQHAWQDAKARVTRHYSPDEPLPAVGEIPRLDRKDYQGRRWATRSRPWVDRIASAWLIDRFIDSKASFIWLTDIRDCPKDSPGYDFDGATFTHVGDKVTFEVLVATFGLDTDKSLQRLAAMVHALDVGGETAPEAVGFEAILGGARGRIADDHQLLAEMGNVLDSLYAHFKASADSEQLASS